MSKLGKITVSNGLQKKASKMNLGGTHITSMDFGRMQVLHSSLLMPKDKVSLDIAHNIRLSPLCAPTIGNCKLKTKAFFIPARVAWEGFESFLAETNWSVQGGQVTPYIPKVCNDTLAGVFNLACAFPLSVTDLSRGSRVSDTPIGVGVMDSYGAIKYSANTSLAVHNKNTAGVRAPYYDVNKPLGEIIGITDGVNSSTNTMNHFVPLKKVNSSTISGMDSPEYDWNNPIANCPLDGVDYITLPCVNGASTDSRLAYGLYSYNYPTTLETETAKQWKNQCHYFVCRFTRYGKGLYNLLLGLGYKINFQSLLMKSTPKYIRTSSRSFDPSPALADFDGPASSSNAYSFTEFTGYHSGHNSSSYGDHTMFNALPIYAYMRMYLDYFAPTQFYPEFEKRLDWYAKSNNYQMHWSDLWTLADMCYSNYEKDIFTSAWQQPNSPLTNTTNVPFSTRSYSTLDSSGNNVDLISSDQTGDHGQLVKNTVKSSGLLSNHTTADGISDLAIRLVRAMTKYSRINNVFGYRAVDRFLGKYGIRPSDERINRSEMVGGSKSEFDVSLVMSQSDTSSANLGDFVGHAESRDSSSLGHYCATEWGYLIIVGWITPRTMYYQGRNRTTLYVEPKDFHDPIIDDLDAMQSIRYDELVADAKCAHQLKNASSYKASNVFGFSRMWHEMKHGYDLITGDFYIDSTGKYTNQSFHLGRTLPSVGAQHFRLGTPLVNDVDFNRCSDSYQFDRIFQTSDVDLDHFYCYFKIDVLCYRYTKSLTDYTLDDENDETRCSSTQMFGTQIV